MHEYYYFVHMSIYTGCNLNDLLIKSNVSYVNSTCN